MNAAPNRQPAHRRPAAAVVPLPVGPSSRSGPGEPAEEGLDDAGAGDDPDTLDGTVGDDTAGAELDDALECELSSPTAARQRQGLAVPADDAQLAHWIERIARQEERALEALYDATSARVHGVVLRITQRAALAEEVLEDTYWQVWRQAPRFDAARGRPITWLLSMARSRAIDALRREQRFAHDELPDDDRAEAIDTDIAGAAAPPQDLLDATRGHAQVHAALASLEPRSRQLVALAFFRGLTHEEIAAQQGMPLGTVKSLIRRALQQLKRVMEASHA
ncbi:MAG: sigma-70 family RNA polymerase sigma factor [Rubrivivax sp.]|nr:sigma-70 family RNA polymerase sigma factor [Rubrivivax sp.]